MPKSPRQKLKLLCLQKIMLEKSDEEHPLTWYGRVVAGLNREDQFTEWQYPM